MMNEKQALEIFHKVIEQSMAQGFFKTLKDLDTVRTSYEILKEAITKPIIKNEQEQQSST